MGDHGYQDPDGERQRQHIPFNYNWTYKQRIQHLEKENEKLTKENKALVAELGKITSKKLQEQL